MILFWEEPRTIKDLFGSSWGLQEQLLGHAMCKWLFKTSPNHAKSSFQQFPVAISDKTWRNRCAIALWSFSNIRLPIYCPSGRYAKRSDCWGVARDWLGIHDLDCHRKAMKTKLGSALMPSTRRLNRIPIQTDWGGVGGPGSMIKRFWDWPFFGGGGGGGSTRFDSTRLDSTRLDSTRLDSTRRTGPLDFGGFRLDACTPGGAGVLSTPLARGPLRSCAHDALHTTRLPPPRKRPARSSCYAAVYPSNQWFKILISSPGCFLSGDG